MPKIVVVGGFLGAGKTSLVLDGASRLRQRGLRVGIVMNDQSSDLVDTNLATALGFNVGEVADGCFCCRFEDLVSEFQRIERVGSADVIFAEPVGSCTDIIATVIHPLARLSGLRFPTAPFSVVVDPTRDLSEMNELVGYLYRRQLAEADIVVVSKIDLVPDGVEVIKRRYSGVLPERAVIGTSAVTGEGIDSWLESLLEAQTQEHSALELDYQKYTAAEAALGWLNLSADWRADRPVALMEVGGLVLKKLQERMRSTSLKAAHVKIMLSSPIGQIKGSFVSNRGLIIWDDEMSQLESSTGAFVLNARAEGTAKELSRVVDETLSTLRSDSGIALSVKRLDCFSPKPPKPTHRLNHRGVSIPLNQVQVD